MLQTKTGKRRKTVFLLGSFWTILLLSQIGCTGRSYPVEFLELASVDPAIQDATRQCLKPTSLDQAGTGLDLLEILVDEAGKLTATRNRSGEATFRVQLINPKTPRVFQRERRKSESPENRDDNCDLIWKYPRKANRLDQNIDEVFQQLTSLRTPFEVEEALGLHISRVTVTAFLPSRSFQVSWFGCDDSPIAHWTQALLERTDRRLNPCNHRGGIVIILD